MEQTFTDDSFSDIAFGHMDQTAQFNPEDDKRLLVRFHNEPIRDHDKSAAEGRPIYREVPHITIMSAGSRDSVVRPVEEMDKIRFSRHWEAFKVGKEVALEGTPLEAWPGISRASVEEFKFFKVNTVEQLVGLSDTHAQKIMGFSLIKRKAQAFLDAAKGAAPIEAMAVKIDDLTNMNSALLSDLAAMKARLAKLEKFDEPEEKDTE